MWALRLMKPARDDIGIINIQNSMNDQKLSKDSEVSFEHSDRFTKTLFRRNRSCSLCVLLLAEGWRDA
jgi:hypothetical protein